MPREASPAQRNKPAVIGIDFGTSKCCVAAVVDGRVKIFENEFGQRTTPSCVAFNAEQRLVGDDALVQAIVNCDNTVQAVKRVIGRTYEEAQTSQVLNGSHLSVVCAMAFPQGCAKEDGNAMIGVNYKNEYFLLYSEEIAAAILSKMKSIAETNLGCTVSEAVVSVPASFNNGQRKAIIMAGQVSGLEKITLINEPTAVALAYASNSNFSVKETILMIDFGAGKLDVSLYTLNNGSVEVKATSGNLSLGGNDIDMRLVEHAAQQFQTTHDIDVLDNRKALLRLLKACEKVKRTLALLPEAFLDVECLIGNLDMNMEITKSTLLKLCDDLGSEILRHIDRCCKQSQIEYSDVDKVLLVGGSSRIPGLERFISKYFEGKITKTVNIEECVAAGAALKAAILSNCKEIPVVSLSEIASYHITCNTNTGKCKQIIRRGSKIPCSKRVETDSAQHVFEHACICSLEAPCVNSKRRHIRVHSAPERRRVHNSSRVSRGIAFNVNGDGILSESSARCVVTNELTYVKEELDLLKKMKQRVNTFELDCKKEAERVKQMVDLEELAYHVKDRIEAQLKQTIASTREHCDEVLQWVEDHPNAARRTFSMKYLKLKRLAKKYHLRV